MAATSRLLTASLIGIIAISCAANPQSTPATEEARLNTFLDAVFERTVDDSPEFQSRLGRKTDRLGEWNDRSDTFADAQIEKDRADLARVRAEFDREALGDQGKLSYDLFAFNVEQRIRNHRFRRHFYVTDQFNGQFTGLLTVLQNNHPIASVEDDEDYLSRVEGLETVLASSSA